MSRGFTKRLAKLEFGKRIAKVALPRLRRVTPVLTGKMKRSWRFTRNGFENTAENRGFRYMPPVMRDTPFFIIVDAAEEVAPQFEIDLVEIVEDITQIL
jgi:hypothetical protein